MEESASIFAIIIGYAIGFCIGSWLAGWLPEFIEERIIGPIKEKIKRYKKYKYDHPSAAELAQREYIEKIRKENTIRYRNDCEQARNLERLKRSGLA